MSMQKTADAARRMGAGQTRKAECLEGGEGHDEPSFIRRPNGMARGEEDGEGWLQQTYYSKRMKMGASL